MNAFLFAHLAHASPAPLPTGIEQSQDSASTTETEFEDSIRERYRGSLLESARIEWSTDAAEFRLHPGDPSGDPINHSRWALVEHRWQSVEPQPPRSIEPACVTIDESTLTREEVDPSTLEMHDIYGRRFLMVPLTPDEAREQREAYAALARSLDPGWTDNDEPTAANGHDDEQLVAGPVEVCDLTWTRDTYQLQGVTDDIWDGNSRTSRLEREPGFPGSLTWSLHEEIAVTVSTGTLTNATVNGGSGVMVSDVHVLTNAHVIGYWDLLTWKPDDGPWMVCGWGSEEWCSQVVAWVRSPQYSYVGDHFNDLAVLLLDNHPGYNGPQNAPVPMALLSTATPTTFAGLTLNSVGYPQMRPGTSANPVFNLFASPTPLGRFVLSGDAFSQGGITVINTTNFGARMRLDAMNGQSGSPIYTFNSFGISTVHALEAGFYNVPGSKGHRGPRIQAHRGWILNAIANL